MRYFRILFLVVAVSLMAASCGSPDEGAAEASTSVPARPTVESAPTEAYAIARVSDLHWVTPSVEPEIVGVDVQATSGEDWPMALAYPDVDAPPSGWPLIVSFHGATGGTPFNGLDVLAAQGAVVVAPRWAPPEWSITNLNALSSAEYADGYWFDVAACGFAAAQAAAADYGADLNRTTVVGFSAGVHATALTALGTPRNNLCPDREPAVRPVAMVAGDSQWLFQGEVWDETFTDPRSQAPDTVDRFLNPSRWVDVPETFLVYLWSTESRAWAREIANPPPPDSWLASRSTDRESLFADLENLGAFDDGTIMFPDNALLIEARLTAAGINVLHEVFPTDHEYAPGVYDRISEVVFATQFS